MSSAVILIGRQAFPVRVAPLTVRATMDRMTLKNSPQTADKP
jgi:hypothetical protein